MPIVRRFAMLTYTLKNSCSDFHLKTELTEFAGVACVGFDEFGHYSSLKS